MRGRALRAAAAAACAALALGCAAGPTARIEPAGAAAAAAASDEVTLLGPLLRGEIEAELPDWIEAEIEAEPDLDATLAMLDALPGAEVTVYLGTWCSDSRRELARLWRALDEAGAGSPPELALVGVARGVEEPRELTAGVGLLYVPTFVVRRDGAELGRIVETAPNGIEHDLLALLTGATRGVVSARTDLAPAEGDSPAAGPAAGDG